MRNWISLIENAQNGYDWRSQYENIVYDHDDFLIVLDDLINARYVALIHNGKKIGEIITRRERVDGKEYTGIKKIEIDRKYRNQGFGLKMYQALLKHITTHGISSYLPDQINRNAIPKIHEKLGGYIHDGDWGIIPRKP